MADLKCPSNHKLFYRGHEKLTYNNQSEYENLCYCQNCNKNYVFSPKYNYNTILDSDNGTLYTNLYDKNKNNLDNDLKEFYDSVEGLFLTEQLHAYVLNKKKIPTNCSNCNSNIVEFFYFTNLSSKNTMPLKAYYCTNCKRIYIKLNTYVKHTNNFIAENITEIQANIEQLKSQSSRKENKLLEKYEKQKQKRNKYEFYVTDSYYAFRCFECMGLLKTKKKNAVTKNGKNINYTVRECDRCGCLHVTYKTFIKIDSLIEGVICADPTMLEIIEDLKESRKTDRELNEFFKKEKSFELKPKQSIPQIKEFCMCELRDTTTMISFTATIIDNIGKKIITGKERKYHIDSDMGTACMYAVANKHKELSIKGRKYKILRYASYDDETIEVFKDGITSIPKFTPSNSSSLQHCNIDMENAKFDNISNYFDDFSFAIMNKNNNKFFILSNIDASQNNNKLFFDPNGISNLYEYLKANKTLLWESTSEIISNIEKANKEFSKEYDFKPEKQNLEIVKHRTTESDRKYETVEIIKARIHNKNNFEEYEGISQKLMPHQKAACEIAAIHNKYAFFYDTGTGKTVLSLEIMSMKYMLDKAKFLVICPKPIIKSAWLSDQQDFYTSMKLLPLSKNMTLHDYKKINAKWNTIDEENGFHDVLYYEDWEFDKTKKEQLDYIKSILLGKSQHYIVNGQTFIHDIDLYERLGITGLIVDESAVLKNYDSRLSKAVRNFAKKMRYVYLLSGKPAPNNSCEYFSQMKIVDPETFHMSKDAYRNQFYYNNSGRLRICESREKQVFEMISQKSIIVSKTDCLNLPDTSHVIRKFELPKKIIEKYDQMCYEFETEFSKVDKENKANPNISKNKLVFEANSRLSSMMKLREITSGFIKSKEHCINIDQSKLNELKSLVDEIGNNPIIIWCQFKHEISMLAESLKKEGKIVVTAFSGTTNLDDSIQSFKTGNADILLAHPQTLQYGVTLVNCCNAIYYSMSYSFEQYEQSYARIYRKGQKNVCSYYFLQAENTIDEEIFECVMNKKSDVEVCEKILKSIKEHSLKHKRKDL